ncbi:hypothetical protein Tco_1571400 [Tanacetum coccineum]
MLQTQRTLWPKTVQTHKQITKRGGVVVVRGGDSRGGFRVVADPRQTHPFWVVLQPNAAPAAILKPNGPFMGRKAQRTLYWVADTVEGGDDGGGGDGVAIVQWWWRSWGWGWLGGDDEATGGGGGVVEARGSADRVDRLTRITFGFGRKSTPEKFSDGGRWPGSVAEFCEGERRRS